MSSNSTCCIPGCTQAGKTTMLNCLAAAIPGGDRVVSAEEVFELRFPHPDWVPMQTRQSGLEGTGEIKLRDLVKESLRMRPSRIIVGEVRSEKRLDLLLALNAGLPRLTKERIWLPVLSEPPSLVRTSHRRHTLDARESAQDREGEAWQTGPATVPAPRKPCRTRRSRRSRPSHRRSGTRTVSGCWRGSDVAATSSPTCTDEPSTL
nr:ATPase, T2SS/T4P/T4SS family [Nocardioides lijunqiniae]